MRDHLVNWHQEFVPLAEKKQPVKEVETQPSSLAKFDKKVAYAKGTDEFCTKLHVFPDGSVVDTGKKVDVAFISGSYIQDMMNAMVKWYDEKDIYSGTIKSDKIQAHTLQIKDLEGKVVKSIDALPTITWPASEGTVKLPVGLTRFDGDAYSNWDKPEVNNGPILTGTLTGDFTKNNLCQEIVLGESTMSPFKPIEQEKPKAMFKQGQTVYDKYSGDAYLVESVRPGIGKVASSYSVKLFDRYYTYLRFEHELTDVDPKVSKSRAFNVGDTVFVNNHRSRYWGCKGTISECMALGYIVSVQDGFECKKLHFREEELNSPFKPGDHLTNTTFRI